MMEEGWGGGGGVGQGKELKKGGETERGNLVGKDGKGRRGR